MTPFTKVSTISCSEKNNSTSINRRPSYLKPISIFTLSSNYLPFLDGETYLDDLHPTSSYVKRKGSNHRSAGESIHKCSHNQTVQIEDSCDLSEMLTSSSPTRFQRGRRLFKRIKIQSRLRFNSAFRNGLMPLNKFNVLGKIKKKKKSEMSKNEASAGDATEKLKMKYKGKLLSLFNTFAGETTAHGYKRWISQKRSRYLKCAWFLLIMAVLCLLMTCLNEAVANNQLNSFSSSFKSQPESTMAFPAVTICNLFPYNATANVSASVSDIYYKQMQKVQNFPLIKQITVNMPELVLVSSIKTFAWDLDKFLTHCSWINTSMPCSDLFVRTVSQAMSCFTFNSDPSNVKFTNSYGGLSLKVNLGAFQSGQKTAGAKVILHDPEEFPNTFNKGILVAPSAVAYISVNKKQSRFLPVPFKAYGTENCFDYENDGSDRLNLYQRSGYSWCMADCRLRRVVAACQCVAAGDPDIPGIHLCSVDKYFSCYLPVHTAAHNSSPSNKSDCNCPLPCYKVEYSGSISTAAIINTLDSTNGGVVDSLVEINIYYEELISLIEEHVPKYLWPDLFGNLGGQIGLFTGASLLTLFEFVELFYLLVVLLTSFVYKYVKIKWKNNSGDSNELL
ncbi:hypothetical protein Btru_076144 [Bulinus truncatus]|nr:hypothetical protein Btru_076144 [Bulinus truncatus]